MNLVPKIKLFINKKKDNLLKKEKLPLISKWQKKQSNKK